MKLSTRNFQAGIDLGTTNSAIAVFEEQGAHLLKVSEGDTLLPSCVYIDKNKNRFVGQEARNMKNSDFEINGHEGFKRKMGLNFPFAIQNLNSTIQAEELSGLLLQRLREVYKDHYGEELYTAIVTVPAKFDLKACDATRTATGIAKKGKYFANFLHVELLMEPVAASLAYGMDKQDADNSSWLVYDFGGGTFDAAIVTYREGRMSVQHHEGNNYLGGRNFDDLLLGYILQKMNDKYDLTNFDKDKSYLVNRSKLLFLVEEMKKLFSTYDSVSLKVTADRMSVFSTDSDDIIYELPISKFKDRKGKIVQHTVIVEQNDYNQLISPLIQQTINIIQDLFRKNQINTSDIDRILLVGGPTQQPYLQQQLRHQLKIDVDTNINPMTAVTLGASIHAVASEPPENVKPSIIEILSQEPTDCRVEINCPNETREMNEFITGQIFMEGNQFELIESISLKRTDKGWESGAIPVDIKDGVFATEVVLREKKLNEYEIEIKGRGQASFTVNPKEFQILQGGLGTVEKNSPFSLNVTITGGDCVPLIKKDSPLPATGSRTFYTTKEVQKDKSDDAILYVELTEGESNIASENIVIGTLEVSNRELKRNLPVDTEVEVTIEESGDRKILASCYIPYTKQSFEAEIKVGKETIKLTDMLGLINGVEQRHQEKLDEVTNYGGSAWIDKYESLKIQEDIDQIHQTIEIDDLEDLIESTEENDSMETDDEKLIEKLMNVKTLIQKINEKISAFDNDFVLIRTERKLEYLDTHKKSNGPIEEKMIHWRDLLNRAKDENSSDLAIELEDDFKAYDKTALKTKIVIHLYAFCLTKQNRYIREMAGLAQEITKAKVQAGIYGSLNTPPELLQIETALTQFLLKAMKATGELLTLGDLRNKMPSSYQIDMRSIFDKADAEDPFRISDYDRAVKIFNKSDNIFNEDNIRSFAKTSTTAKVLRAAKEASKAWVDDVLEECSEKAEELAGTYYIEPAILEGLKNKTGGMGGSILGT